MPLQIRELQIRVTVDQPAGTSQPQQTSSAPQPGDKNEKEAIINQCIEQVLDILNNKKER
jgi:hypothetical protein